MTQAIILTADAMTRAWPMLPPNASLDRLSLRYGLRVDS